MYQQKVRKLFDVNLFYKYLSILYINPGFPDCQFNAFTYIYFFFFLLHHIRK